MKPFFEIAGRQVGCDYKPLVIAEIGINHEGSLDTAKQMIDAAKKTVPGNADVSIYEIMRRCSLKEEEELEMKRYVESKGMIFISTPFSRAATNRLQKWNVPAYKIGSGECNNYPLVEHIASFGKPVILSTGMNTIESVSKAVAIFKNHRGPYALLH